MPIITWYIIISQQNFFFSHIPCQLTGTIRINRRVLSPLLTDTPIHLLVSIEIKTKCKLLRTHACLLTLCYVTFCNQAAEEISGQIISANNSMASLYYINPCHHSISPSLGPHPAPSRMYVYILKTSACFMNLLHTSSSFAITFTQCGPVRNNALCASG